MAENRRKKDQVTLDQTISFTFHEQYQDFREHTRVHFREHSHGTVHGSNFAFACSVLLSEYSASLRGTFAGEDSVKTLSMFHPKGGKEAEIPPLNIQGCLNMLVVEASSNDKPDSG